MTSLSADELRRDFDSCSPAGSATSYCIASRFGDGYAGRAASGRPAVLIPVSPIRGHPGFISDGVTLKFDDAVHFEIGPSSFTSAAAVLECAQPELLTTFCVLAIDIVSRIGTHTKHDLPNPRDVSDALVRWERLLRAKRELAAEEERGLWGELWMLTRALDLAGAVDAWRGPTGANVDFFGHGVSIEVKTSLQRLKHHVSQTQLERPMGDRAGYVVSLWVAVDARSGLTIVDLVDQIDRRLGGSPAFESRLLETGFSRTDVMAYRQRLTLLEDPLWFPLDTIPRIRLADPGVSAIRFVVSLPEERALAVGAGEVLFARVSAGSAPFR